MHNLRVIIKTVLTTEKKTNMPIVRHQSGGLADAFDTKHFTYQYFEHYTNDDQSDPLTRCLEVEIDLKLEFGMYPQSMPTEWTHARTLRPWQSVRLDL